MDSTLTCAKCHEPIVSASYTQLDNKPYHVVCAGATPSPAQTRVPGKFLAWLNKHFPYTDGKNGFTGFVQWRDYWKQIYSDAYEDGVVDGDKWTKQNLMAHKEEVWQPEEELAATIKTYQRLHERQTLQVHDLEQLVAHARTLNAGLLGEYKVQKKHLQGELSSALAKLEAASAVAENYRAERQDLKKELITRAQRIHLAEQSALDAKAVAAKAEKRLQKAATVMLTAADSLRAFAVRFTGYRCDDKDCACCGAVSGVIGMLENGGAA